MFHHADGTACVSFSSCISGYAIPDLFMPCGGLKARNGPESVWAVLLAIGGWGKPRDFSVMSFCKQASNGETSKAHFNRLGLCSADACPSDLREMESTITRRRSLPSQLLEQLECSPSVPSSGCHREENFQLRTPSCLSSLLQDTKSVRRY